jgi:hypothetical protein
VKLSLVMLAELKDRLEMAARAVGMTENEWMLQAIEAQLRSSVSTQDAPEYAESSEFLHEQKLDDIRAMRENW